MEKGKMEGGNVEWSWRVKEAEEGKLKEKKEEEQKLEEMEKVGIGKIVKAVEEEGQV